MRLGLGVGRAACEAAEEADEERGKIASGEDESNRIKQLAEKLTKLMKRGKERRASEEADEAYEMRGE